jgi:peroxiredoxin
LFLLVFVSLLAGCDDGRMRSLQERISASLEAGAPLPAYAAPDLQGDTVQLDDLHGSVVLLNVWATWCKPCVAEFPVLEELHQRYSADGFRMLGVTIDNKPPDEIRTFLEEHSVSYPSLMDRQWRLQEVFGWGKGVPQSLLIDRAGRVAYYWRGGVSPSNIAAREALNDTIQALLR